MTLFSKLQQKYADSKVKFQQVKEKTEQKIKRVMDDANRKQDKESFEFRLYSQITAVAQKQKHRGFDIKEDVKARLMVRQAESKCLQTVKTHFKEYIENYPDSTYEEWIAAIHPENVFFDEEGRKEIDHRFYAQDSVHRLLWNKNLNGRRHEVMSRKLSSINYMGDLFWFEKKSYNLGNCDAMEPRLKDETVEITFI